MVRKGRQTRGAEVHWAKLTDSLVLEIRTAYATGAFTVEVLATEYGVGVTTVRDLLAGKTWAHVGGPRVTRAEPDAEPAPGGDGRAAA